MNGKARHGVRNAVINPFWAAMRSLLATLILALAFGATAASAVAEKTKVVLAVGGKTTLYYLPLTLADRLGYFTDEGLDVEINDFPGGAKALQALIDHTQAHVNGTVKLKLYKGTVLVSGRRSKTDSLFDASISTFEDDGGAYNQADAEGFIRLNALRLRIAAKLKRR